RGADVNGRRRERVDDDGFALYPVLERRDVHWGPCQAAVPTAVEPLKVVPVQRDRGGAGNGDPARKAGIGQPRPGLARVGALINGGDDQRVNVYRLLWVDQPLGGVDRGLRPAHLPPRRAAVLAFVNAPVGRRINGLAVGRVNGYVINIQR